MSLTGINASEVSEGTEVVKKLHPRVAEQVEGVVARVVATLDGFGTPQNPELSGAANDNRAPVAKAA